MKALTYTAAHSLNTFALEETQVPDPVLRDGDLLIDIKATGFNPVDAKIRQSRSGQDGKPVILGWDASGVVAAVAPGVTGFDVGDEVYYAGDLTRDGSYAEKQAVDHRLVAKKPVGLGFAEAAAIPLTALTAWEMLFEQLAVPRDKPFDLLVIGGAGGVPSLAVQMVKTLTRGRVFATSGRPETTEWLKRLGADGVLDRSKPLTEGMKAAGVDGFDYIFSTHSEPYFQQIPDLLKPFGTFGLIDDPKSFDVVPLKRKAQKVVWELMFTKSLFDFRAASQGDILRQVADLIDANRLRTTLSDTKQGLTAANVRAIHEKLENGLAVGKMVVVH